MSGTGPRSGPAGATAPARRKARKPSERSERPAPEGKKKSPSARRLREGKKSQASVPPTVMGSTRSVGRPTPTGTPWPALPQVPMPVSSAKSLPMAATRVSTSGAVADQARALERRGGLAVLDQIGLGGREHELARGDVHLAAAEVFGVDALGDPADDLVRRVRAVEHEGVGHARHGGVGVALPAAVAGRLHAHQAGVHAVLQVAAQDAVLDQHGAAAGRALVIDGERAAPVVDGAVVDHGDPGRCDPCAEKAGEGAGLLAVEVAFEAVADRLVQQDAGPAGAEHHRHLARRRRHRVEIDHRLAQRLVDLRLPALGREERVVGGTPADPMGAGLLALARAHHDRDVEAHERAYVGGAAAVGADDLHDLPFAEQGSHHLAHARLLRPRIGVDLGQQRDLGVEGRAVERIVVDIERAVGSATVPPPWSRHGRVAPRGRCRRLSSAPPRRARRHGRRPWSRRRRRAARSPGACRSSRS